MLRAFEMLVFANKSSPPGDLVKSEASLDSVPVTSTADDLGIMKILLIRKISTINLQIKFFKPRK